jgi:hypothetical protein
LLIAVENESMTIRLVFGGGWVGVGYARRAMRCARVGVEKCVRFSANSEALRAFGIVDGRISG